MVIFFEFFIQKFLNKSILNVISIDIFLNLDWNQKFRSQNIIINLSGILYVCFFIQSLRSFVFSNLLVTFEASHSTIIDDNTAQSKDCQSNDNDEWIFDSEVPFSIVVILSQRIKWDDHHYQLAEILSTQPEWINLIDLDLIFIWNFVTISS